jgi:hypothetical protein
MLTPCFLILFPLPTAVIMLISTALLLDSNIRNSVCTPAKLPCRRVVEGSIINKSCNYLYTLSLEKISYLY